MGETVNIGPVGGTFGGTAVEMALAIDANVIALGRSEEQLEAIAKIINNPERLRYVCMRVDEEVDLAAIRAACPGGVAQLYNDWTPTSMSNPPYLATAVSAIGMNGRVVLSSGGTGRAPIPYGFCG
jgi:hypothetical protein